MKKALYTLLLAISLIAVHHTGKASAQSGPVVFSMLSTLSDLRAFVPIQVNQCVRILGLSSATDGNGGDYMWNSTSTATDDGFITVQVTGVTTGRWVRIGNSNTLKTSVSFSAVSLQNTYTVSYGQTFPFTPRTVIFIPTSSNASVGYQISAKTASNFTIVFNSVPLLGTISGDVVIIKQ